MSRCGKTHPTNVHSGHFQCILGFCLRMSSIPHSSLKPNVSRVMQMENVLWASSKLVFTSTDHRAILTNLCWLQGGFTGFHTTEEEHHARPVHLQHKHACLFKYSHWTFLSLSLPSSLKSHFSLKHLCLQLQQPVMSNSLKQDCNETKMYPSLHPPSGHSFLAVPSPTQSPSWLQTPLVTVTVGSHVWLPKMAQHTCSTRNAAHLWLFSLNVTVTLYLFSSKITFVLQTPPLFWFSSISTTTYRSSKWDRTPAVLTHEGCPSEGLSRSSLAGQRAQSLWSWSSTLSGGRWWWRKGRWSPAAGTVWACNCCHRTASRRRLWVSLCGWPSTACYLPHPASGLTKCSKESVCWEYTPHTKEK